MKNKILIIICCISLLICGCAKVTEEDKLLESTYNITNVENVSISIYDVKDTGAVVVITDTNDSPYTYEEEYIIEQKINGVWYDLGTITDNYGFNEMAYLVDDNNQVTFNINWESLYGKLPSGTYRIIKNVDDKYIAVEFNLATTSEEQ